MASHTCCLHGFWEVRYNSLVFRSVYMFCLWIFLDVSYLWFFCSLNVTCLDVAGWLYFYHLSSMLSELSASVLLRFHINLKYLKYLKYFHWSLLCFISFWYSHYLALYLFQLFFISCIVFFFFHLCLLCFSALEVFIDISSNSLILASNRVQSINKPIKGILLQCGFFFVCLFLNL